MAPAGGRDFSIVQIGCNARHPQRPAFLAAVQGETIYEPDGVGVKRIYLELSLAGEAPPFNDDGPVADGWYRSIPEAPTRLFSLRPTHMLAGLDRKSTRLNSSH